MDTPTKTIAAACTVCGKQYRLSSAAAGKTAKCVCGNRFVVKAAQVDKVQAPTPRCAAHPDQAAVGQCIQCASRICRACAMRTKSGQLACRACVAKHREKQRTSNAARQEIPTAELVNPTETALPRNVHNEHDEQVPLAEIIDDDNNVSAAIPVGAQPAPPSPSPFDGLPSTATASAFPTSGPQWFAAAANVADGSRTGTGSVGAGGTEAGSVVAGGYCPQHPASAVVHHCSICHKAICRTCTFAFAPNLICCPECASETSTPLSLHRQAMVYSSLACAIFASLMAALLFSGLLVFMDNIPFGGLMLETLIVLPLCLGIGTAFGSYNRAEGNPAMLWVGGIWNGLGLIAWMLFLGIMTLSGLLIE